jgi:hypothetical protein
MCGLRAPAAGQVSRCSRWTTQSEYRGPATFGQGRNARREQPRRSLVSTAVSTAPSDRRGPARLSRGSRSRGQRTNLADPMRHGRRATVCGGLNTGFAGRRTRLGPPGTPRPVPPGGPVRHAAARCVTRRGRHGDEGCVTCPMRSWTIRSNFEVILSPSTRLRTEPSRRSSRNGHTTNPPPCEWTCSCSPRSAHESEPRRSIGGCSTKSASRSRTSTRPPLRLA